jgi:hypothetical protein
MKKPTDVAGLADRLTSAASAPLVPVAPVVRASQEKPRRKEPNRGSVSVFLRLSPELFAMADAEAIKRTKATGRGVTVQQVILDKLAGAL